MFSSRGTQQGSMKQPKLTNRSHFSRLFSNKDLHHATQIEIKTAKAHTNINNLPKTLIEPNKTNLGVGAFLVTHEVIKLARITKYLKQCLDKFLQSKNIHQVIKELRFVQAKLHERDSDFFMSTYNKDINTILSNFDKGKYKENISIINEMPPCLLIILKVAEEFAEICPYLHLYISTQLVYLSQFRYYFDYSKSLQNPGESILDTCKLLPNNLVKCLKQGDTVIPNDFILLLSGFCGKYKDYKLPLCSSTNSDYQVNVYIFTELIFKLSNQLFSLQDEININACLRVISVLYYNYNNNPTLFVWSNSSADLQSFRAIVNSGFFPIKIKDFIDSKQRELNVADNSVKLISLDRLKAGILGGLLANRFLNYRISPTHYKRDIQFIVDSLVKIREGQISHTEYNKIKYDLTRLAEKDAALASFLKKCEYHHSIDIYNTTYKESKEIGFFMESKPSLLSIAQNHKTLPPTSFNLEALPQTGATYRRNSRL